MKAAVYTKYGTPEVVQVKEVPKPVTQENEILVKVEAATVTAGDWRMRAGNPFAIRLYNGLFKLKRTILGHEFSGVVESVGKNVTQFKVGDAVFGTTGDGAGAHAEFVTVPADCIIVRKPDDIPHEKAAALPVGALTALYFLQQANVKRGQKVLIHGASGSVGTYAVQLAKHFGAGVTAVCSGTNVELVRSLGADKVIDYRKEDFTTQTDTYDIVFDAVGKASFSKSKNTLKLKGTFLTVAMSLPLMFQLVLTSISGRYKLISTVSKPTLEDLQLIAELAEKGAIKPVIDRTFPLSEIRKAHELAETGHKKGNVVLKPVA
ncbi:MAG: NAD(P)-dependent alcohol dehydrogenase [Flavobacteriales bacterium]|nr:NAD(P)-dependent alcohol dehydrogenase [Flavobacteriales bacterium]MCB9205049.1 NAD(P)-dependent alcohol dehydrogenase [Flavobacteriales bacterium]